MEKVLITGGRGTVGSHLQAELRRQGYAPYVLTRNEAASDKSSNMLYWDPKRKILKADLSQFAHIINLAGEGIADKRWTKQRKKDIINSRVQPTRFLIDQLNIQGHKIQSFISASAVGDYGDSGDRMMSENDHPIHEDFLSQVCQRWEEAAYAVKDHAEHLYIVRIGTVLTTEGGAFPKLTATLPAGIINTMGKGNQYMSWIHITDLCKMMVHLMSRNPNSTIYNGVSPEPVTNALFARKLKNQWHRPAIIIPAPTLALKIALGEMSAVVLNSNRASSEKIQKDGFEFEYRKIDKAIEDLLSS
jgi:uncharacterized protein (TIGR01777 family)